MPNPSRSWWTPLLAATLIAAALPVLTELVLWPAVGQSERILEDPGVTRLQVMLAIAPFLVLWLAAHFIAALRGGVRLAVGVGLALTVALWGGMFWEGYRAQTTDLGGGAHIGLGILMLFLPVVLSVLMTAIAAVGGRSKAPPTAR